MTAKELAEWWLTEVEYTCAGGPLELERDGKELFDNICATVVDDKDFLEDIKTVSSREFAKEWGTLCEKIISEDEEAYYID